MRFERLFCGRQRVKAAIALRERGDLDALGQCHVGAQPLEDRPALGPRPHQAVGRHHVERVFEVLGVATVTQMREERREVEPVEVRLDRGHGAEARSAGGRQLVAVHPGALGVMAQRGDDAIELLGPAEFTHLAQAQERVVRHLAVHPDRLDQRQVRVGLVAPFAHRRLHEHTANSRRSLDCAGGSCRPYIYQP